jgi:hypothetical protein
MHRKDETPGKAAAVAVSNQQQQQQTPPHTSLSIRAAVAKEEADLHRTYFNVFAAHDSGEEGEEKNGQTTDVAAGTGTTAGRPYRMPDASAFAPSATRRATDTDAAAVGDAAPGSNAYGDHLYGAVPSHQAFFARFQAGDE